MPESGNTEHPSTIDELADLARSLANPHRLTLLDCLSKGESAVEALAEQSGLTVANTSQHLQQLKRSGFVQTRRDGKRILYRLGDGPILAVLSSLQQLAEHNRSEVRALADAKVSPEDRFEGISREELLSRMTSASVTLLDVRPSEEYAQGHLPGAINVPLETLADQLSELPVAHDIVAYCRGPYCTLSGEAVSVLRAHGLNARRLNDSVPDWQSAGLPVEKK